MESAARKERCKTGAQAAQFVSDDQGFSGKKLPRTTMGR
jgi:hypothetical protein